MLMSPQGATRTSPTSPPPRRPDRRARCGLEGPKEDVPEKNVLAAERTLRKKRKWDQWDKK